MSSQEVHVGSEPDARKLEWLRFSDRNSARPMPLPRSLAHLKREIHGEKPDTCGAQRVRCLSGSAGSRKMSGGQRLKS